MKLKVSLILFISTFIYFNLSAQTSTTTSGNWNTGSNWTSGVPSNSETANVSNDMTLDTDLNIGTGGNYIITGSAIDLSGGGNYDVRVDGSGNLDVGGPMVIGGNVDIRNDGNLIVRSYDTLIIRGNVEFRNNSSVTIETDGVLIIEGDLELRNNNSNLINGKLYVKGDVESRNNAIIDGTGNVQVDGDVDIRNSSSFFGSGTGCPGNCEYGSGAGLPIELISFDATLHPFNNNLVEVKWTTLSEINNQYFVIEHSIDGENFETIDQIDGAGNSNKELNYSRIVNIESNSAQHYFRLKQIDFDGSSKTFYAVALKQSNNTAFEAKQALTVYPNPSNGENLKLSLQNFEAGVYDFVLLNSNGQAIVNSSINLQNGISDQSIDLLNGIQLSKGIYFVRMISKEEQITKKIIVN
jgi:hypothetical protein